MCRGLLRLIKYLSVSHISIAFSIFTVISSIVTMVYFGEALTHVNEYNYVYDYKPQICTPINGFAYNFSCNDQTKWISILNTSIQSDQNQLIVQNPFSFRNTRAEAIADRKSINMNFNYTCYCRSNFGAAGQSKSINLAVHKCSLWPDCIIDSEFIHYMQHDNSFYHVTFISFLVSSGLSIIFSILSVIITVFEIRSKKTYSYTELETTNKPVYV